MFLGMVHAHAAFLPLPMRVISVIEESPVIEKILRHLGLAHVLARVGDRPQSRLDELLPGASAKALA